MALPRPGERFVMKPLDSPQTWRSGDHGDVEPLFVALEDVLWHGGELLLHPAVLVDAPHARLWLYHKWYVKALLRHNAAVQRPRAAVSSAQRTHNEVTHMRRARDA